MPVIKKTYFLRLILTNLSVITIVLILVLIIQNSLFLGNYKEDIVKGHYRTLTYMQEIIDSEIQALFRLSSGISIDRDLSYFKLTENPHEAFTAVQKLRNYFSANAFINKIILAYYDDSYLYTSEGSYTKRNFITANYNKGDYLKNQVILSLLNGESHPGILKSDKTILFSYQYPTFAMSGSGVIIYEVVIDDFRNFLKIDSGDKDQYNLIFDLDNKLLISSSGLENEWIGEIENGLSGKFLNNSDNIIHLKGEDYLIQYNVSDITGLTYVSLISLHTALAPFNISHISLLYSFAIIYMISIILSYYVSRKNYNPFKKMKTILLKGSDGMHIDNELLWMEKTILSMNQMIDDQKLAFKNNSINKLIQKKYNGLTMFISEMEQSGYLFPFNRFGFLIIQFQDLSEKKKILEILDTITRDNLTITQKDSMQAQQVLFLYNTSLDNSSLKLLLTETFRELKDKSGISLTMGVGTPGDEIDSVNTSLAESITAMEYKFVIGKNNIIFYSDLMESKDFERPLTASELDSISFSIYSGEIEEITRTISKIIDTHNIRNLSLLNAKSLTYQIANRVLRTIDEILNKRGLPISLSADMQQHLFLGSVDEMVESISNVLKDLEPVLNSGKEHKSSKTVEMALEIVDISFTDAQLSVQDIADRLNVSLSYLSRVFKKQKGITILSCITDKRIEMAKNMLWETDLSIKEIMEEIGYLDLSSFTRKFKSMTGVTPGNFRKTRQ